MSKFPAKWEKHLPTGFVDSVNTMNDEEMESTIFICEKNIHITEKEMEEDATLKGAKDLVKDYNFKYRVIINAQKAKIKYIIHTLDGRGKVSDEVDDTVPDGSDGN